MGPDISRRSHILWALCANTLSQQIMIELWVTAPVANSRMGVGVRWGVRSSGHFPYAYPPHTHPPPPHTHPALGLIWSSVMFTRPSILSFYSHTKHSFFIALPLSISIPYDPVSLLTAHTLIPINYPSAWGEFSEEILL